jgi:ribosomal protein L16/L10AE
MGAPPVVARVAEGRVLLDLRTIQPDEEAALAAAVVAAAG